MSRTTEQWDGLIRNRHRLGLEQPTCLNCMHDCRDKQPHRSCTGWWGSQDMTPNVEDNTHALALGEVKKRR